VERWFSIDWLEERKRQMGSAIFASQYQNDTELMKGDIFREEGFRTSDAEPDWSRFEFWIGCDPAATKADVVTSSRKATSDYWTIVVGGRERIGDEGWEHGREFYVREVWRARCTKQEYLDQLKLLNERYRPRRVLIESVAAQEYLAQDAERHMPVKRVERTKDKVSRAYWLQAYFENGQILFPAKHLQRGANVWQALQDELVLFPQAEHDDLFDGLQTAVEGAMKRSMGVQIVEL